MGQIFRCGGFQYLPYLCAYSFSNKKHKRKMVLLLKALTSERGCEASVGEDGEDEGAQLLSAPRRRSLLAPSAFQGLLKLLLQRSPLSVPSKANEWPFLILILLCWRLLTGRRGGRRIPGVKDPARRGPWRPGGCRSGRGAMEHFLTDRRHLVGSLTSTVMSAATVFAATHQHSCLIA